MIAAKLAADILELLRSAVEGMDFLLDKLDAGGEIPKEPFMEITDLIPEVCGSICKAVDGAGFPADTHRLNEIYENITWYAERTKESLNGDMAGLSALVANHFYPFLRLFCAEVAFLAESSVSHADYPDFYPDSHPVDRAEIERLTQELPPIVSIVVLAYNKLDYTKLCVNSILNYTKDVDYELILVDNGSTDATLAYFKSVPGATVVHIERNLGVVKGFNMGMMVARGRYTAAVCNDFIFTHRWLSNLLLCLKADKRIGYVSPGATNISNLQQIDYKFTDEASFHAFAEGFNRSNPAKWEERVVLLPNVLCCPTALLDRIGYYDTRYYYGEFADDDISFRIRRAGYRLVYCADTVTHHFGSVTTTVDHRTNNSLAKGRRQFTERYGLDAWVDARMSQASIAVDYSRFDTVRSVLGIGVRCGASLLHARNSILRRHGAAPAVTAFEADPKYGVDLKTVCDETFIGGTLKDFLAANRRQYDLVYLETPLGSAGIAPDELFQRLAELLNPNGFLVCSVPNPGGVDRLLALITGDTRQLDGTANLSGAAVLRLGAENGLTNLAGFTLSSPLPAAYTRIIESFAGAVTAHFPEAKALNLNTNMTPSLLVFLFKR